MADEEIKTEEVNGEAPAVDVWPIKIKLEKSIRDKDAQMVDEITFREPTGGDISSVGGNPVIPNFETGEVRFDAPKMTAMISRLSQMPIIFINQMSSRDWNTCATRLQRFFLPDVDRLLGQ